MAQSRQNFFATLSEVWEKAVLGVIQACEKDPPKL
jgi:hypothetical protein